MALSEEDREEIKRHMGVLQENCIKEVKIIGEGHAQLRKEIQDSKIELKQEIRQMDSKVDTVIKAVTDLREDVKKHDQKLANIS